MRDAIREDIRWTDDLKLSLIKTSIDNSNCMLITFTLMHMSFKNFFYRTIKFAKGYHWNNWYKSVGALGLDVSFLIVVFQ